MEIAHFSFFLLQILVFILSSLLSTRPSLTHSSGFICQLLLLSYDFPLFLDKNHLRPSLVALCHFLQSILTLPTLSLMRAQVASASSSVSRWGVLTSMAGSGGGLGKVVAAAGTPSCPGLKAHLPWSVTYFSMRS